MSASKKKRMGSQRRALNVQESPENSDKSADPPVTQGRQRADTNADLTLSPDSAQAETSVRKKKLGSQRGNKGKLQFKDVTTESGHKPIEEVEDSTTHSEALGIKNEGVDESLERSVKSTLPEAEASEPDDDVSNINLSTMTKGIFQKSTMDATSDILVNVPIVEKYLNETPSTEEGVLSEKDPVQQMPDIFETTVPSGVMLTEHEGIKVIGSHDHNNKHSTESKARPNEKPVCQESDKSFQPTAKSRKMGSSRRKKVTDVKESQDIYVSAADVAYKEEGQVEIHLPSKMNEDEMDMDYLSHVESANFSVVTQFEEPHMETILAIKKDHDEEIDKTKLSDNSCLSELSFVEFSPTGETDMTSSHHLVTDAAVVDVEEAIIKETGETSAPQVSFESSEINETITSPTITNTFTADPHNHTTSDYFTIEEDNSEQSVTKLHVTTDETITDEPMFRGQPRNHPSTERLLNLDDNVEYNLINETAVSPMVQTASTSSVSVTPEKNRFVDVPDGNVNIIEQPEPPITEGVSIIPDEVYKEEGEDVNLSNEQMVQKETLLDSGENRLLSSQDIGVNDVEETKSLEKEESSSQIVCDESLLHHNEASKANTAEESLITAAEAQEPIIEHDAFSSNEEHSNHSVSRVLSDSRSESTSSAEDEAAQERKPSIEEMSSLDHNIDEINISTTSEFIATYKNETDVKQDEDFHPIPSSSVSEILEDKSRGSIGLTVDSINIENENVHPSGVQSEPSFTDTVNSDSNERYPEENQEVAKHGHKELVYLQKDISSEPTTLHPIDPSLTSYFSDTAVCVNDAPSKTLEVNTSVIGIEEIQVEPLQSPEMSLDFQDQVAGLDKIDPTDRKDLKYTSNTDEEVRKVEIGDISDTQQSTEQSVSNDTIGEPFVDKEDILSAKNKNLTSSASYGFVLSEADENNDENHHRENDELKEQQDEASELFTVQIPHTDDISATLPVTQPDPSVSVEDDSAATSHFIGNRRKLGSSRRMKGRRQDNNELKPEEIDIMPEGKNTNTKNESNIEEKSQEITIEGDIVSEETQVEPIQRPEIAEDNENQAAVQDKLVINLIKVDDEDLKTAEILATNDVSLKPSEVTMPEAEQITEDKTSNVTDDQVLDTIILEQASEDSPYRQEIFTEDDTEQSDVHAGGYVLKETINVHQLTYISDSETHEEIDNSSLKHANQPVLEENVGKPTENEFLEASSSDAHHDRRRKLGSSRRVKESKKEAIRFSSKDVISNDTEEASQVSELVEVYSAEKISQDFESEFEAEQMNQGIVSKPEGTGDSLQPDDSIQEKDNKTQSAFPEESAIETQTEISEVIMLDSVTIEDLKNKGTAEVEDLPCEVDRDNTSSQTVARSEEIISTADFAKQSDVVSAEGLIKEPDGIQVTDVSETTDMSQINSKRRKMGSTRRSQLNWNQQDENRNAEVDANIPVNENGSASTVSKEDTQPLSTDISVNRGEDELAADQHQSKESTFTHSDLTQKGEEEILQTEAEIIQDTDKESTTQTLLPLAGEEIQPASPGKRRKMGSTRKNLMSKRESPQDTPTYLETEGVMRISNDNESKLSDSLVYATTVHQPPPDEENPLSQQVSQKSESGKTELSSQHEAIAEDAAIARRRKMGSHRKPHSDQSISQRRVTDSEESLLHPLGERRQTTEASDDNKAASTASAFNIKYASGLREKIPQQPILPSTNVRRVQESNVRIASGFDRSAIRYEVVMIGDSSVGKTSFIQRAQSGKFSPDVPASIGMDSYKWTTAVNGKNIVLHLWDTAGQERFRSMTKQIFHRAQAFLLMYDVTCAQTFAAVSYWANCIKDGAGESVIVLLLGNKSDRMERKVNREEGEILAEENSFAFMECSAATGENVMEALETVARLLSQKADSSPKSEEPLMLRKPERKNKLGCC